MKYQKFCEQIIDLVGGIENIEAVVHCMTRLRFTLKDRSKTETESIKALTDVIDVVSNEVAYQIIIGTQVAEIHEDLLQLLDGEAKNSKKEKTNPIKAVLDLLSESMGPILEPIMAAGMLAGILSIISITGFISTESPTYILFDSIRNAVFFFLPVYMAMSCAKRLHASPFMAVTLAVTLLSTSINGVEGLRIFGLQLPAITYSNSFFPIILGVWFMGYADQVLTKLIPDKLIYFFKPALLMIICLPITLIFFGPIGTWIGDGINLVCNFMMNTFGNWSVVMLYAACQPFLIMMGAGNFIIPVIMNFYATLGYDPVFMTACMVSDVAVAGAVFGYFLKTKDSKQKQLFGTTAFSAIMGITEPAVYGVFVKYRRPFIAVIIGGGLGGLFAGIMQVKSYALVGLLGITSYIGNQNYNNFYFAIASVIIGFIGAMTAAYLLGIPQDDKEPAEEKTQMLNPTFTKSEVQAPCKGRVMALNQVKDKAFATGALGKGIAIQPEETMIHAPVNGEIVSLFPTKHAVGIKSEYGIEVLVHIGIDTVELEGKFFEALVKTGDTVRKGENLIQADFEEIKKAGYDTTVITVITNTNDYLDVLPVKESVFTGVENCMTVIV